ncbi:Gfo/Idh/MocA family oxidoreductase [Stigmatella sp. ncwal1]|uniref:Gfo/Idh/MocA family oxidoreductase n=1 Tax=Stigmatella ashevillensis TaxID=2995309 RepID=A0ABT5D916_9BACT|nr:Gfo/Idh/MocA family oxidoreductase [Stigmatella ashevillena]MDC0710156.1 Gfo/Idh/MocA family oxidoreductase [Stigmatella ashevillena]
MPSAIQWGILGTGNIASQFAEGLRMLPDAGLLAVGSRSRASADAFASAHGVPHAYDSYEALVRDPNVDVIYIATPNHLHKENSLLCLNHGKAVLCEKPFTLDAEEAALVVHTARVKRLFCMEGMWNRFVPIMRELDALLRIGAIGDIRMLDANLGFPFEFNPHHRVFAPALGGGALLDLGVYPVSLALWLFGRPTRIISHAVMGTTGVDEQVSILLGFAEGRQATLTSSVRTPMQNDAVFMGTQGMIHLHAPLYRPETLTRISTRKHGEAVPSRPRAGLQRLIQHPLLRRLREQSTLQPPKPLTLKVLGNGYAHEAAEVMRCMREGLLESPFMPLNDTLLVMQTMDAIRGEWRRASEFEGVPAQPRRDPPAGNA